MAIAVLVARLALGLLLIATGALKLGHAEDLAAAIAGFRLLPAAVVGPLGLALPLVEILLGAYLAAGLFTRAAAWFAAVQFVVYAGAIASAVIRHIPANCGCFGPNDSAVADWPHVGFDLALALVAIVIATFAPGACALDRRFRRA
ncbi:MAG: DoxX family membrane protein [Candidatus Eremiobacteraeota bacterium]|nr:DoxX family membrane protein [Candidatus Eremiobacteraeota bacterium]